MDGELRNSGTASESQAKSNFASPSGIEEVNIAFSRRGNKKLSLRDRQKARPQTTPVEQRIGSKSYAYIPEPTQEDGLDNGSNYDAASTNYLATTSGIHREDDYDNRSDQPPLAFNRTQPRGFNRGFGEDTNTGIFSHKETSRRDGESPRHGFNAGELYTQKSQLYRDSPAEPSIANGSGLGLGHERTRSREAMVSHDHSYNYQHSPSPEFKPRGSNKLEEKSIFIKPPASMGMLQAHPKSLASVPGFDDALSRPQTAAQERTGLGEESIKKILKDTEEHYKSMMEDQKRQSKEERVKLVDAHQKEIDMLKREKQLVIEQTELSLRREIERMKELHSQETESIKNLHKYEIEREKHLAQEQAENLKHQLEAQTRLSTLAEEYRSSSTKINSLFERIQKEQSSDEKNKKQELDTRVRQLEDQERKVKLDLQTIEREKERYDRLREDLEARESEVKRQSTTERELLQKELSRLSDLQREVRDSEQEKWRELTADKEQLERLRVKIEKENLEIKKDYTRKYKELDVKIQEYEKNKQSFEEHRSSLEQELNRKQAELDEIKQTAIVSESEALRKLKNAESKELLAFRKSEDLEGRLEVFESERSRFQKGERASDGDG